MDLSWTRTYIRLFCCWRRVTLMQDLFVNLVSASSCCVQCRSLHQTSLILSPPDTNTNCISITPCHATHWPIRGRGWGSVTNERPGLGNCISITPRVMTLGHSPLTRYDERRGKYSARTHSWQHGAQIECFYPNREYAEFIYM